MRPTVEQIASQIFTRKRADGTTLIWHQENESAATSKADAIGMVQRTLDFWIPQVADDLVEKRGITRVEALAAAKLVWRSGMAGMLAQPFPRKWGLEEEDFNFDVPD
jgi:hypothetical protein